MSRTYRRTTIGTLAAGKFLTAHARVSGQVVRVSKEADGDIHIRLSDDQAFIICEIIPELPIAPPKKASKITAWGIVRYDGEHKWWELHPLIGWN